MKGIEVGSHGWRRVAGSPVRFKIELINLTVGAAYITYDDDKSIWTDLVSLESLSSLEYADDLIKNLDTFLR